MINTQLVHLYSDRAGFVLAPTAAAEASLLCAYPGDGGTMSKLCKPPRVERGVCVPGCYSDSEPSWCPDESRWWHCNYPPERLDQMMRVQVTNKAENYNEILLDVHALTPTWPGGIEAIFYVPGSGAWPETARAVHRQFVLAFGEAAAGSIPLLQLDLTTGTDSPFSVAT